MPNGGLVIPVLQKFYVTTSSLTIVPPFFTIPLNPIRAHLPGS